MKGILLINLGTPQAPTTEAVRAYLKEFLSDPGVIQIPSFFRFLLVRGLILPFRSPRSAALYQKIWTKEGSPLLVHTKALRQKVAEQLGENYRVAIGMRYGKPSIQEGLEELAHAELEKIDVLPLFPQYAVSSYGSATQEFSRVARTFQKLPPIHIHPPFFDQTGFIRSFADVGRPALEKIKPDHVLFSFHGLPAKQADAPRYQNQCFRTAKAIAEELKLPEDLYTVSFQSRLGPTQWLEPYTDRHLADLAQGGAKRIAIFAPSFVADCLETLEELQLRAAETACHNGAQLCELIPSLNTHPTWVKTVCEMVK
ncbi:MAG: ferrochelatase [bacterium]|nr:ferrochelatase [bacterium]